MQLHYKNIPISINNKTFIVDNLNLSSEIQLTPQYTFDNPVSEIELPTSMWKGSIKLAYYLTGFDYLKQYIYTAPNELLSGNIGGLMFNQGALSSYSFSIQPNSPILISAEISFYDKLTGTFTLSPVINNTGTILRSSDIQINNLSSYTENVISNYLNASFDYSCNIIPSISYFDTGITPTKVDSIFMQERTINTQISCDNTNFSISLSGEKFGSIFNFYNPYNTGLYETFGCSGLINQKTLSINTNSPHTNTIKITQHHVNKQGYIYSVQTGANNLNINFNTGSFPLSSRDNNLNYIDKIFIGDTELTGYFINRTVDFDQITGFIPFNVVNDILTIHTNYGNYVYPNKLYFPYSNITITGISNNTGQIGDNIIISGTNFVRISDVFFGGNTRSQFQVLNPQTIQATIPYNGITNPIIVSSNLREISGVSPNNFYYQPYISSFSPVTGLWKDTVSITGTNFSGITGIYFNNTAAYSFNIINNNLITAQSPETGMLYPSGYIKIYGTGGYGQSSSRYSPQIPIYNFYPISGTPGSGIAIYTKIDTGYLYPLGTESKTGYISLPYNTNPSQNLLSWYPLDGDYLDYGSGNNNLLTFNNLSFTYDVNNIPGCALSFNGIDNYATTENDPLQISSRNYYNRFTISTWWSGDTGSYFISRGGSDAWSIKLSSFSGSICIAGPHNTVIQKDVGYSSPSVFTGWNNTTLTYDGSQFNIYNNGVLRGQNLDVSPLDKLNISTAGLNIGRCLPDNTYYSGNLDDIRIYSTPLSSGNVNLLYTGKVNKNQPYSGYINTISGGYKVKVAGQDARFYISGNNSTGILTGVLPNNIYDDYIYIYHPNGISTSVSSSKFNVVDYPQINYISPTNVNRYKIFNLLIVGTGFGFFDSSSFLSFSGYNSGDIQTFNQSYFNHSLNGNTLLAQNINITGNTGYYDISINNVISGTTLKSGIFINDPINQSNSCTASTIKYGTIRYTVPYNNNSDYYSPSYSIDNSNSTFVGLATHSNVLFGGISGIGILSISPITSQSPMSISSILINNNYTGAPTINWLYNGSNYTYTPSVPPTGYIVIRSGNNIPYTGSPQIFSGYQLILPSLTTGVTSIEVRTNAPAGLTFTYAPIYEVAIY